MTTRYESGRAFEYRVRRYLEKRGLKVIRSAGSHSPVDLLAGRPGEGCGGWSPSVKFAVQCKHNKSRFGPQDASELIEWANAFDAIPILASNDSKGHIVTSRVERLGMRAIAI